MGEASAGLVHVVLFRLPPEASADEAGALMADIEGRLAGLPMVRSMHWGVPADTKTRPVVQDDYDVGLLAVFEDRAALEAYLAHPDHAAFAEYWDTRCGVRVFDFQPLR
jgi:hypothetical protein